jgi:hypothetical protein
VIIDTGTDLEVIGGSGWTIIDRIDDEQVLLGGALTVINVRRLQTVNAVTAQAYEHPVKGVILLGVGNAVWDDRDDQKVTLVNPNELPRNNVLVNDIAKVFGSSQNIVVENTEIALDFHDGKVMSFNIRQPTAVELQELCVKWLTPRIDAPGEICS